MEPEGLGEDVIVYIYDGTDVVVLEAKVVDNTVIFETDHLSYFVVDNAPKAIDDKPTESESTIADNKTTDSELPSAGDNMIILPILLAILVSGMFILIC